MIKINDEHHSLIDLIEKQPIDILGQRVAMIYDNQLPYLFKVLAADAPLSIQAHPNTEQAAAGFARENDLGIPIDDSLRNYRDEHHKPECICALTPFWCLCGFRRIPEILSMLKGACPQTLHQELHRLEMRPYTDGLRSLFQSMMTLEIKNVSIVIQEAMAHADVLREEDEVFHWMVKLEAAYPADIGVVFPAVLNLICLQPGEAMFLSSGELHAYLHGVGIELMANSDNVLRGGLTPKHVDVPELMHVLTFQEKAIDILRPEAYRQHEKLYRTPADEFALSVITLKQGDTYKSPTQRSAEIMLVTEGRVEICDEDREQRIEMKKGVSVIVPAAVPQYRMKGEGVVYKAAVPLRAVS
jgi:mannose-6-phosphate isomerase